MLDDEGAHLRAGTLRVRVPEAEHGADGVDRPVARRGLEACPLAGARIADLEDGADDGRVLVAARQRGDDTLARHQDQMLDAVALTEHELAAGDAVVLRARDTQQAEHQGGGETPGDTVRHVAVTLYVSPRGPHFGS